MPFLLLLGGCLGSLTPQQPPSSSGAGNNGGSAAPVDAGGGNSTSAGTMICNATLSLTGQWQQGNAPPTGFPGGCWPDGSWTFSASITQNNCATAPSLQSVYHFQVMEDDNYNDTVSYLNDPSAPVSLQISGGEGGVCVGAFLIFSSDGKTVLSLRPAMQADNSINGKGEYQLWTADQR